MSGALRPGLPALPQSLRMLPIDERGYPVPYFVAWVDGKPDHRVVDADKLRAAVKRQLCMMCGQSLYAFKAFCIGPMCGVTRVSAEPPSHVECLRYAVRACPWMTRPQARRREAGLPDIEEAAGISIKRNPGVAGLWVTRHFKIDTVRAEAGVVTGGVLFKLGDPVLVEWWALGERASRAQVEASVASGLHHLEEMADLDDERGAGGAARRELAAMVQRFGAVLDASFSTEYRMTETDTYKQLIAKARDAKRRPAAWGAQSTGEKLAVALVLNRPDLIADMGYTLAEAIDRLDFVWLTEIPRVARALAAES